MDVLCELAAFVGVAHEVREDCDNGGYDLDGDVPARADDLYNTSPLACCCHIRTYFPNELTPRTMPNGKTTPNVIVIKII